jgi:hypothetical protein
LTLLDIQATIHLAKSEYIEVRNIYSIIASRTSRDHSPRFHAHSLASIAYIDILMAGNEVAIQANLDAAKAVYTALVTPRIQLCFWLTAELHLYRGDAQKARAAFQECLLKTRGVYPDIPGSCLASLSDAKYGMTHTVQTFRWAVIFLAFTQKRKEHLNTLHALRRIANIFISFKEEETALNLFHIALQGATQVGIHRLRAECMVGIGDIMMGHGDLVEAKGMWEAAHPLFIRSSQIKDATAVEAQLHRLAETEN